MTTERTEPVGCTRSFYHRPCFLDQTKKKFVLFIYIKISTFFALVMLFVNFQPQLGGLQTLNLIFCRYLLIFPKAAKRGNLKTEMWSFLNHSIYFYVEFVHKKFSIFGSYVSYRISSYYCLHSTQSFI